MRLPTFLLAASLAVLASTAAARADAPASPAPSPTPGVSWSLQGSNVFVDQSASGSGIAPPEGNAFAAGSPLSPMSPYDWFSSAPQTPGVAGTLQYAATATARTRTLTSSFIFDFVALDGDAQNASYWGEPLFGNASPHWNHLFDPAIAFPAAPGRADVTAATFGLLSASLGSNDGSWKLRGGYFDLAQTDRFVFAPPPVTNVDPQTGVATAETLGPGSPNLDAWGNSASSLPLLGVDALARVRGASVELTDALLPAISGSQVRLLDGSLVLDRGSSGRFSAQVSNIQTSGAPISTTTFFGAQPTFVPGPQGRLFTSVLADQRQTVAGVRAFLHPHKNYDALAEVGRGWYSEGLATRAGTQRPGNYIHLALTRHFDARDDAGVDYYRFDPRYAVVIMPYGIPENVWSVAWSWPGQWLKSTYQSVDNSIAGINRAGFRAHLDVTRGKLDLRADAYAWHQLEPATIANASQEGWVDGYFLPQYDPNATAGWQRQVALYAAWHFPHDDVAVDAVWDRSYRPSAADPVDYVSMNYPQVVASVQHHFDRNALAVAGFGRYSANGMWSTTPVAGIYGVAFAGAEWNFGKQQLLVQVRRQALTGLPSIPGGPSPSLRGVTLVVDQRLTM